ncbi:MAG: hypothetical protein ACO24A_07060, partial [Burkholderiaceae bacterium]
MPPPPQTPKTARLRAVTQARLPSRRSVRWALVTPGLALFALAALMASTIWYLTENEHSQRAQTLARDVDAMQRNIRDQLRRHEAQMDELAKSFATTPSAVELTR